MCHKIQPRSNYQGVGITRMAQEAFKVNKIISLSQKMLSIVHTDLAVVVDLEEVLDVVPAYG